VILLLAGIAVLALVEVVVNLVLRPQVGPPALLAAFEPHLLAIGAVCGALALLLTINERNAQASRIRVIAVAVIVVALVRVGGEWWSPGDNRARGEPSPSETRLAIMSWNLEVDSKTPQDVVDGILDVRQPLRPQVVALQELTPDVAAALEASAEIDQRFPYRILEARDDVRGMGILSSVPLVEGVYGAFPMLLTAGLVMPDGSRLDLVNAHPLPPRISTVAGVPVGLDTILRDQELRYVRMAVDRAEDQERVLLVGDLNTTPFEPGFAIVTDGLQDLHAQVASGTGFTWRPAILERLSAGLLRIDHVLAGSSVQPIAIAEDCSLPGDHCRVTAVVDVPDAD
jgi:endonuclease/exonuclease/phosphatase (EEP) superfamily protein YafD